MGNEKIENSEFLVNAFYAHTPRDRHCGCKDCIIRELSNPEYILTAGAPQATGTYTSQELSEMGITGIYRSRRNSLQTKVLRELLKKEYENGKAK